MADISPITKKLAAAYVASKDKMEEKQAGPKPDLDPDHILAELAGNDIIKSQDFKNGKISICFDNFGSISRVDLQNREKAIVIIQRGLIALGLMNVDTTQKYWWRKPGKFSLDDTGGGISWGNYGPRTERAIWFFQLAGCIDPKEGREGKIFGRDTEKFLETALKAMAEGKDWVREVVKEGIRLKNP